MRPSDESLIFFLRAYARCGAESCYDCSGYRCDDLHDKLDGFLLTHNLNV